jgi:hypothetical protein
MNALRVAAAVVFCAAAVHAQELDLFDPNDFIDPRERGAVFKDSGFGTSEPGDAFTLTRAYAGRVSDYQWRNTPTNADLSFAHLTTNFYRGDKQLNLKLTVLEGNTEARVPAYRGTIQFGQYFVTSERNAGASKGDSDLRMSGRWLVTLAAEENTLTPQPQLRANAEFGAGASSSDPDDPTFLYEFGFEVDGYLRYRRAGVVGSIVWMRRKVAENQVIDRLTYVYRLPERPVGNVRLNASLGFGGERNDGWQWGATRALLVASYDIERLNGSVNLAYGPTVVPGARHRNVYHELAVYVDSTLLARLKPVRR